MNKNPEQKRINAAASAVLGVGLGAAPGVAFDNISLGVALGNALGLLIAAGRNRSGR